MSATGERTAPLEADVDGSREPTGLLETVGAAPLELVRDLRGLRRTLVTTLRYTFRGRRDWRAIAEQMYAIGNRSVFFLSVTMGFIGMIMIFQSGVQTKKIVPDLTLLGANYIELLVRDFAASIGAMMLATRVGAGIAAEIGSMVVTEQTDALRMCAADPIEYLVVPRFVASVLMTTVLVIWACFIAMMAGMLTANTIFDVNYWTFLNFSLVDTGDVVVCFAKCLAYGAAIPIVSAHRGLHTFGGSEGVGWATTNAVVHSSLAVIVLNFFISSAGWLIFGS